MEHKISSNDESKMVSAIEKAAMLASCKEKCDVSKTLADCLLENNVDSRFAKTASAAFNRRLTVLKFQKADDASRGETFGLANADDVFSLMGGEAEGQKKTASEVVRGAFKMELVATEGQTKKAAERPKPRYIRYEERTTIPIFERHVESIMDKQAALYMNMMGDLKKVEDRMNRQLTDLANELVKTARVSPFDYQTVCNLFGERLDKAIGKRVPETLSLAKTAAAIDPGTPLTRKVAKTLDDYDSYVAYNDMMCDYKDWLGGFAKAAADTSKEMHKKAVSFSAVAGNLVRGTAGTGLTLAQAADDIRQTTGESFNSAVTNINNLYRAVGPEGMSPSDIITADFISKDRMYDRMLAISDIMADPYISQYPAEQQFAAANKVMDLHPSLEGAGNREMLKTEVSDLLMRNNRNGKADIASTAAILASLGKAAPAAIDRAVDRVREMDKVTGPEVVSLDKPLSMISQPSRLSQLRIAEHVAAENSKDWEDARKEEADKRSAKTKETEEINRREAEMEKSRADDEEKRTRRYAEEDRRIEADRHTREAERISREKAFFDAAAKMGYEAGKHMIKGKEQWRYAKKDPNPKSGMSYVPSHLYTKAQLARLLGVTL